MRELEQETQTIEQVPNTYYYEKIYDDKHLGSFTESTELAYQLGWQDNTVAISDTEVSDVNGWAYLKGYAPKKSEEAILEEAKSGKLKELSELVDKIFASSKTYLISSLGFRINSGSKALEDINGLIVLGDEVTDFNDFDNVIRKLSVEQLEVLRKEVIMAGQSIKKQKWAYRNQVENAKSVEILQKIEFEFAICDFKDKQQE